MMTRAIMRGVAVGLLGAIASAAMLVAAYARAPALVLSLDADPPTLVRGLYPIEREPDGLSFAWTRDRLALVLPGLDRNHDWTFVARVKAGRGPGLPLPTMAVDVDGVTQHTVRIGNAWQDVQVSLPTRPGRARGARITLDVSPTFVPGPADPRPLGVVVDELRVDPPPSGIPIVPVPALFAATVAGALFGLSFALIGFTADRAVLAVLALAIGQAAALTHGSGPYAAWIERVPWVAFWIGLGLVGLVAIIRLAATHPPIAASLPHRVAPGAVLAHPPPRLRNTALFVAAFSAGVLYLMLLVLLHPDMPIGDGVFQAHRFEWVRAGRWFFTSVAPGGYEFPYAIGLYLFAMPFAGFAHGTIGYMEVLRIVVAAAHVVAGALLYPAVVRRTGDRLAGAFAVAAFQLVPLGLRVQTTGNLTNAFAQSLFVVAMAIVLGGFVPRRMLASAAGLTVVAAAAMLSHTSTFAILVVVLGLAGAGLPACRARRHQTTGASDRRRGDRRRIRVDCALLRAFRRDVCGAVHAHLGGDGRAGCRLRPGRAIGRRSRGARAVLPRDLLRLAAGRAGCGWAVGPAAIGRDAHPRHGRVDPGVRGVPRRRRPDACRSASLSGRVSGGRHSRRAGRGFALEARHRGTRRDRGRARGGNVVGGPRLAAHARVVRLVPTASQSRSSTATGLQTLPRRESSM